MFPGRYIFSSSTNSNILYFNTGILIIHWHNIFQHIRFANAPEDARSERGMDAHPRGMDADSVVFGQHGLHSTA